MNKRKPVRKPAKKMSKNHFEERLSVMVAEYNSAKELLDSMTEGTDEHAKQKKKCEKLFASTERFVNAN
ncbi:hypothetical protein GT360_15620 [Vibrio astriarenae]|uniref:Uncharacterized protein n=1 Tax=Vibrio astriarenae TaxID=1481923 RepID=A0A7Z2T654_9VIBR|nr:hypothetical protein [Vibrio astriarenae]QIA64990.1 hypothetical protein GT360_15620 [Vibrio astriarenae]